MAGALSGAVQWTVIMKIIVKKGKRNQKNAICLHHNPTNMGDLDLRFWSAELSTVGQFR